MRTIVQHIFPLLRTLSSLIVAVTNRYRVAAIGRAITWNRWFFLNPRTGQRASNKQALSKKTDPIATGPLNAAKAH